MTLVLNGMNSKVEEAPTQSRAYVQVPVWPTYWKRTWLLKCQIVGYSYVFNILP